MFNCSEFLRKRNNTSCCAVKVNKVYLTVLYPAWMGRAGGEMQRPKNHGSYESGALILNWHQQVAFIFTLEESVASRKM
jgi:hypothetical protein